MPGVMKEKTSEQSGMKNMEEKKKMAGEKPRNNESNKRFQIKILGTIFVSLFLTVNWSI